MLTAVMTWWMEQMRDLVPASLRASLSRGWRPELVAVAESANPSRITLVLRSRGGESLLGSHELSGGELRAAVTRLPRAHRRTTILRTPPDLLLEQEVILPMSAEPELKRVVAYEMDRLTPFRADEVLWTCLAGQRDTARGRLHVRLTFVPLRRVEPLLAALRLAGIAPVRIEAGSTVQSRRVIPLADDRPARRWLGPRADAYAMGGCGVLAAAAIALPFILQSIALTRIDARIEAVKPQVAAIEKVRKQIATTAAAGDVILAARKQVGSPLQSIALVTEALPDDTYVTTLSLRERKVSVSGRSAAAARLIGAMTANPLIHGPAFIAPVVRDETNGGQMFSIRAELGP